MKKSDSPKNETNNKVSEKPAANDFLIVGIGAAAGGIQALKTFFKNVPADSGAAYVVILHLSPDHDSQLAEVLRTVARIPVAQVKEKVRVEPNYIYVVSPNESLSMADGQIVVSPIHTVEERRAQVDIFFRTLAESHRARAVAVVLSGTGADGSMGIKRVKENGGAAFVQNPREAEFGEMPRNSIATELIDEILNVADIPAKIIEPAMRQLEEALMHSRSEHRHSIEHSEVQAEELKASSEESQAINEELRSATEELETGKEELQSVNEKLIRVNQELKIKIDELSLSNNDLRNLINSTNIGTIFLDRSLRVKMFTPAAREIFNLIDTDLNRPLADITTKINFEDLHHDVERVLESLQSVEREIEVFGRVESRESRVEGKERRVEGSNNSDSRLPTLDSRLSHWFLMQITPSRTADDQSGAIITFVNITTRKQAEEDLRESVRNLERQTRIFDTTLSSITDFNYIFDKDGRFVYSNQPLLDLLGITSEEIVGKNFFDLNYPEDLAARLHRQIKEVFETGEPVRDETPFTSPTGAGGFYEYIFSPVAAADGSVEAVAGSTRDVTTRKRLETNLGFLAETSRDLIEMSGIDEIMRNVGAKIGAYLDLSNCALIEINETEDAAVVNHDWHRPDAPGLSGVYRFSEYLSDEFQNAGRAGENFIVNDTQNDSRAGAAAYARLKIGAFLAAPVVKDDEWRLMLVVYKDAAHVWQADEIELMNDLTKRVWARLELTRSDEALRESEERYRNLFDSIDEGFCVIEVIFDENEQAVDYRFLEVNPTFEKQTGLLGAKGKRVRELIPDLEAEFFEVYGKVALTGEPIRFISTVKQLNILLDLYACRVGGRESRKVAVVFSNITMRRQMEQTLRESEEKYRGLFDLMDEGYCIIQMIFDEDDRPVDYRFLETNPAFEKQSGLQNAVGKRILELAPDLQKHWFDIYGNVALTGEPIRLTSDVLALNRWLNIYACPVGERESRKVAVIFNDVTTRQRAEEKLREASEFNSAVLSSLPAQIAVLGADGGITAINEEWRRFARENGGEDAPERTGVGVNYLEVCRRATGDSLADARRVMAGIESILKGNLAQFSHEYPCHSPVEKRWFLLNVTPLRGGRGGAVVSHLNITTRKLAEEALHESEERLRLVINSVEDYAITTTDVTGIINGWNPGAKKMFGYAESEIIGQPCDILFTPEDRENGVPAMEMQTAMKNGSAEDERFHLRRDGTRFYVSGVMQSLKDGKVDGFVKIARDMTERIKAEQIGREKEMLQTLVGAQEDERKRIARDLHDELGQLLTGLRLKLEAVGKLCEGNRELRGKIDETQTIAKHLDAGIDFLAWELRPAALDDLGLYAALAKYVREWAHYSGIAAELLGSNIKKERLAPEAETNLYRIAQEALNNVHKHAKASSVEVSLEKRGEDLIVLIINDDGSGFDPKNKMNRGKGIGLIGMRERAALIGGSLEIESAPGKGTTIFVRVPATFTEKENLDDE